MARLVVSSLATLAITASASPVEEVITLLTDLKTSVVEEGKTEATAYETFACFCKDTTKEKSDSIKTGHETIDELSADIASDTALMTEKQAELAKRETKQNELASELSETQARCMTEEAEFEAKVADLKKALSSLGLALEAMQGAKGASFLALKDTVKQSVAASLELAEVLQLTKWTPKQQAVVAFLQQGVDPENPEYKMHNGPLIDTLKKLEEDFTTEKDEAVSEMEKAKSGCTELKKTITDEMKENNDAMDLLKGDISDLKSKIAENRESLVESEKEMKENQEFLKEVTSRCESRANTWDQRSKMRGGEVEALSAALEILEGKVKELDSVNTREFLLAKKAQVTKAVSGSRKTTSFLQEGARQLKVARSMSREDKANEILRTAAQRLNAPALSAIAEKIAANPFLKVKAMIQNLIEKLLDDLKEQAEKKGFCDQKSTAAVNDRDYRFADGEKLTVELNELEIKKDELKETIKTLEEEVVATNDELKAADEAREEEKDSNLEVIKKAKEGKNAVKEAISILKTFYNAAARKHVFLQKDIPSAGFEGGYKGAQDKSEDIIGLLATIQGDFERTVSNTENEEKKAAAEHELFTQESLATVAAKEKSIELNNQDLETTRSSITTKTNDLEDTQKMVDAALKTLLDLKPLCYDGTMTYEEKVAKKEEEIASLKRATCYLDPDKKEDECKEKEE